MGGREEDGTAGRRHQHTGTERHAQRTEQRSDIAVVVSVGGATDDRVRRP
jgi:hypothetical protein